MQKTKTSINQEIGNCCRERLPAIVLPCPFKRTRDVWSFSQHRGVPVRLQEVCGGELLHCTLHQYANLYDYVNIEHD